MKIKPIVSILMNCFNAEKFIKKSIKSALNQTFKNFELVIWDDASTDKTVKIIKSFKTKKIRFFFNKSHMGLGKSRILAQKYLKGKYVSILDADDIWEKNKIEIQIKEFLKKKNLCLVASWYKLIDENNVTFSYNNKNYYKFNFLKHICADNIFGHSTILYKKSLAKKVGWYDRELEYAQDYDLTTKLLKINDFRLIPSYLAKIRIYNNSMTFNQKLRFIIIKEKIIVLKKIYKLYNLNLYLKFKVFKSILKQKIKLFFLILLNKKVKHS